jgi:hypothetical protein
VPDIIETIDQTILSAATDGVASHTADGETTVAVDPVKLIELHKYYSSLAAAKRGVVGWNAISRQRGVPPGAGPD